MATLSTLRTAVYSKIGLDSTVAGTDETLVTNWINEGVREVLMRTHCRIEEATTSLTADEWTYDLSASIMALKAIVDSDNEPVEIVSFDDILYLRRSTASAGSTRLRAAIVGSNMLAVWPTPTSAASLTLYYVPVPTAMSDGTHDPVSSTYGGIPVEFHHAIELWALAKASDYGHEQRTQSGVAYLAQFDEYIRRVVRPAVSRKGGRLPRALVGTRVSRRIHPGNDVYPR